MTAPAAATSNADLSTDATSLALGELPFIANQVGNLIRNDPFSRRVHPECLHQAVLAYPSRSGKMLRPALLMWSCGAVGGNPAVALPAAAAVELFHTWTLVHDDIIDNDDTRRGLPSTHRLTGMLGRSLYPAMPAGAADRFGVNMAILAGDVQQAWSNHLMLRLREEPVSPSVVLALVDRLNSHVNPELISGEALDVALEQKPFESIKPDEIDEMVRLKTGVLLGFSAEAGAMIGLGTDDREHPTVRALSRYAELAGLAFQLQDDLLGMFGNAAVFGKPIGSDLRAGKRTQLFAEAASRLTGDDRARLFAALGNATLDEAGCEAIRELLRRCGAVDAVQMRAETAIREALACLTVLPHSRYRELLHSLGVYLYVRHK